ncbi:MAG: mechanosensitive ion channel protein MscS [Methanomicrobiales archaeon HGW-Methanomicrobiales-4]|nr:MAG: mechanosensitive ion channel protein MscS [Methanomicrobiales archaeon HGW-Methanomicrobiales-4]
MALDLINLTVGNVSSPVVVQTLNTTAGIGTSSIDILNMTAKEVVTPIVADYTVLIFFIIFLYFIAFIFSWIAGYILQQFSELFSKDRVTIKMLIPLVKIVFYSIATSFAISLILKPGYTESVAFFGLFGAALGYGVKDLVVNIIGGIVIIIEKPYQIGDKVAFGGYYGEVTDIGLRTTRLITPSDDVVTIPNYQIFSSPVSSGNFGRTAMMVVTDLFIDNSSDFTRAQLLVRETIASSPYVIISDEFRYTVLIQSFPFYRMIRAKAYVTDHRSEFEYQSDLNQRAWDAMNSENIHAPSYPLIPEDTEGLLK